MKIAAGGLQVQAVQEIALKKQAQSSTDIKKRQDAPGERIASLGTGTKALPEDLIKAIEKLNEYTILSNSHLQFQIHQKTKKLIVKVIGGDGEIIREIPPEKALEMLARLEESCGAIIDCYI